MRKLRLSSKEDQQSLDNVLLDFFNRDEKTGDYHHGRIDKEIAAYQARAATSRANGANGGRPKKNPEKPSGFKNKPDGKATSNQEPVTSNQKPNKKSRALPDFDKVKNLNRPAWDRWVKHRREILGKPRYRSVATANKLAKYNYDIQTKAVALSIDKEWLDLYPEQIINQMKRKSTHNLSGKDLVSRCEALGISTHGRTTEELREAIAKKNETN